MGGLFMIFISQAILCILVFLFTYHLVKENAKLKEEIERFKEASGKKEVK
jgi:hypothetical protein